ncbi:hypothetical protein Arub01_42810 [Actinomadura rubrobrunea]|uniref:Uncharacterized protein n=1 Tax=Actinomadura rubrobrunea TaxID=115335 RepID=A0A9W6PYB4_9ACTN|nr:hypothetical protein [Actinomadura rubrobrunea]GLW66037.1 hypothetical protein Arub01_42810 [Actinomadura rubrobrunea]
MATPDPVRRRDDLEPGRSADELTDLLAGHPATPLPAWANAGSLLIRAPVPNSAMPMPMVAPESHGLDTLTLEER